MRLRLGLLQDAATIERQAAKEAAEAAAKKKKQGSIPTVKTEAQAKADERAVSKAGKEAEQLAKPPPKPRIRPLSEAKAIETGSNFISEAFLFSVGGGLILFESWRSRRKENTRREDVADRLNDLEESEKAARRALIELEREVLQLRTKDAKDTQSQRRILPQPVYEAEEKEEKKEEQETSRGWPSRIASYILSRGSDKEAETSLATNTPGPAEKILIKSDETFDVKHKAIEAEGIAMEQKRSGT
jgi:myosin-1